MSAKVFAALGAGIVAVNAAGYMFFNSLGADPLEAQRVQPYDASSFSALENPLSGTETNPEDVAPVELMSSEKVEKVADQIVKSAGKEVILTEGSPGLPVDTACGDQPVLKAAAISAGGSQPTGSFGGGASYQVKVYPAGTAAAVVNDAAENLRKCGIFPVALSGAGETGFYYNDTAVRGGPTGTTVVFHYGSDFVGVVATRDVSPSWAVSAATSWSSKWGNVLKTYREASLCKPVGVKDAVRNPVWSVYEGWQRPHLVKMNSSEEASSVLTTAAWYGVSADSNFDKKVKPKTNVLPDKDLPFLGTNEGYSLPWYPDYLNINVDPRPKFVNIPDFPVPPTTSQEITIQVKDSRGPGCGWKFLGYEPPEFNSSKVLAKTQEKYQTAVNDLVTQRLSYDQQRWQYAVQYAEYEKSIKDTKAWQRNMTYTIATAWWDDYDLKYAKYKKQYSKWEKKHQLWEANVIACESLTPEPETTPLPPNPTPSAVAPTETTPLNVDPASYDTEPYTPDPSTITFTCPAPAEPVEPAAPTLPSIPRP